MQELCQQCSFDVEVVNNGIECLALLDANHRGPVAERFNLVLCDVMMAGMDGREVLTQIRDR